jgi:hypothetical protein
MKKPRSYNYLLAGFVLLFSSELLASAGSDYRLGVEAYKAGDNTAAALYFESAMKQGMESVALQYNLASSYYRLGRYEESKKLFMQLNKTVEMREISEYHLGLIAIEEKNGNEARQHFSTVVNSGKDKKLTELSKKHLIALLPEEDRWKGYFAANLGYDDNISSVSGDSVLDTSDSFYDLFASVDLLISGRRKHGWIADAYIAGIDYSDTDTSDENRYRLGLKRAAKLNAWDTSAHISLLKSTYGDDDFQSVAMLDLKGQRPVSSNEKIYLRYRFEDITSENFLYDYLEGWRQRAKVEYRHFSDNGSKKIYYELELNDRGELATQAYTYEYSPTRHTVRGSYTHAIQQQWWLSGDLSYRFSDYETSSTIDREDKRWQLALSSDYRFDRTFKLTAKYQYTDNTSTVGRYEYDKSIIKLGLSKLF